MVRLFGSAKMFFATLLGGLIISLLLEIILLFFKVQPHGRLELFLAGVILFGMLGLINAIFFYLKYLKSR
jgi:hypothetical protein